MSAQRSFGFNSSSDIQRAVRSDVLVRREAGAGSTTGRRNGSGVMANDARPAFAAGKPTINLSRLGLEKFVCFLASPSHF